VVGASLTGGRKAAVPLAARLAEIGGRHPAMAIEGHDSAYLMAGTALALSHLARTPARC